MSIVLQAPSRPGIGRDGRAFERSRDVTTPLTTVGIVHASRLIRDGLCDLLAHRGALDVAAAYGSVGDVASRPIPQEHVLLLDLATARAAGAEALMALHRTLPQAKVLMFNVDDDDQAIVECVRAGASGCILQEATFDELLAAVQALVSGMAPQSPRVITSLFSYVASLQRGEERAEPVALTPREEQILALMAEGLSNKEIAARLVLQPQTVKNYAHLVMQKLDLHSRLDVVRTLRARRH